MIFFFIAEALHLSRVADVISILWFLSTWNGIVKSQPSPASLCTEKKVARPFPPPSCPTGLTVYHGLWLLPQKIDCVWVITHPLARPFRRTRIILLDVAITWPIIVTQPFYSKTDRYLYLRNPSKTVKQRQGFSQFSSLCEGEKSICRFIMSIRKVFLWECNNDDYIWQSTFV